MERPRKRSNAIIALLLAGGVISVRNQAFAHQEGGETSYPSSNDQGASSAIRRNEATADFSMAYGLPGKPGYTCLRPFDYFHFEFTSLTMKGIRP